MKQSVYGALCSCARRWRESYTRAISKVAILFAASFLIFAIGLTND